MIFSALSLPHVSLLYKYIDFVTSLFFGSDCFHSLLYVLSVRNGFVIEKKSLRYFQNPETKIDTCNLLISFFNYMQMYLE